MTEKYVTVSGIRYRIFKRPGFSSWYIRVTRGGKNRLRSLFTDKLAEARVLAKALILSVIDSERLVRRGIAPIDKLPELARHKSLPTIGQVHGAYLNEREGLGRIGKSAVKTNAAALMRIAGCLSSERSAGLPVSMLTECAVLGWMHCKYIDSAEEFGEDLNLNGSINSGLSQARSVFCKTSGKIWEAHGWDVPAGLLTGPVLDVADTRFQPIPGHIDSQMMLAAARELEPDPRVIYQLARFCGLTRKEIHALEWGWIEKDGDRYVINLCRRQGFKTKRGTKDRRVPLSGNRYRQWIEWLQPGELSGRVVTAGSNGENFNKVCAWFSSYVPGRSKKLHELRKQAGSEIYNQTKDVIIAANFLGDSVNTAIKHYVSPLENAPAL